ncbi:MAG: 50S ribosomal protein L30 [Clostridia bacterium]|jgi:large subunit ribosomal protein L30|nr:50S ribosomal protein L30 [Clostridia bacterium]
MVKVTLVRSTNGEIASVKATVAALGLKKIRQSKTFEETPANMGQIKKVSHLVSVEKV